MKKLILSTAFLLCTNLAVLGGADPAPQQILITAKQQAALFHDEAIPFQLDVDFVAQMNVPTEGHLTLKWKAKDIWWRRTVMGAVEQTDIRNGDMLYTSRNLNFTPVRIRELIGLLQFAERSEGLLVKKQKQRLEHGVALTCLQVKQDEGRGQPHDVCVNPTSREIVSDEWSEPPDEKREELYTEYFDFERHRYPRKLDLLVNGSKVITANVQNLTTSAFDQTLLVKPKGAIERRQCDDMKHAVPVKTPNPMYPSSARQNKLMGDAIVSMTVLKDGSVTGIQLIGTAARSFDEATLQTLKSWRFKPAMCGAEPVDSDIEVTVSFRVY